jgi:hypothetical protein
MATDPKAQLKEVRQRKYLSRDFDSLRATLLDYARQYYPNQIQDFSESSVGGLFLDMAAYVGDNMSFYLDHLYNELNYETAVEPSSIERALINSGIPINGSSPSSVRVTAYIEVPTATPGDETPDVSLLPVIKEGTIFSSSSGVYFTLIEDIKFAIDVNSDGNYSLNPSVIKKIGNTTSDGKVTTYLLSLDGMCVSGNVITQNFQIGSFTAFRQLTLSQPNVTEIISVVDDNGNTYYEVGALTHDVVYKNVLNTNSDISLVKDTLRVIPAPYRFTKSTSLSGRTTTLTFGGGNADTLEDDVIPDPSEFAIAFPYSKTMSRVPVNPEKLLTTNTLGVAASNVNLTVTYRAGGGLNHNVSPGSISVVSNLIMQFPKNPSGNKLLQVRGTLEVSNLVRASGGEDALTTQELLALIPNVKNSQERIVTKEDLLARVYTMPSNLGRVFRAAIVSNPNNPLATQLFIVSRDDSERLIQSPDNLKLNLKKYLNSYRMVSDAIDVLDAYVVNLQLKFTIVLDPSLNRNTLLAAILSSLQEKFNIKKMQINQPIVISDVVNTIFLTPGVIAVDSIQFTNISGTVNNLEYSTYTHDVKSHTKRQLIFPPPGGIFEIRYPDVDIIAKVVT